MGVKCHIMIIFLNAQKSNFPDPNATFNGTTVMGRSKAAQSNWTPLSKVNIKWATAICLKKIEKIVAFPMYCLHTRAQA